MHPLLKKNPGSAPGLYENLISNNFRRTAVLKKYDLQTKASLLRIVLKNLTALYALEDLEPLFKFPIHLSLGKSQENYRQTYGKSKASLWRNLSTGTPPHIFKDNPLLCTFSLQLIFLSEQPFY